jgi:hypothetical protein
VVRSGVLVTPRDRAMLAWIGRHGIVTPEQAARRFFARSDGEIGMRAAYRRLAKLESLRLVRRDATPLWRSPHVIRITQAGAKAGEIDLAPARLVEPEIRHSLALVDLMEELNGENPGGQSRTEREIRSDRFHERSSGTRRPGRGRTPDGELSLVTGKVVAVELDLTPKRTKDFERILRSYKQERFDLVWWYVLPGALPRLSRVVTDNRADDFVEVRPWVG